MKKYFIESSNTDSKSNYYTVGTRISEKNKGNNSSEKGSYLANKDEPIIDGKHYKRSEASIKTFKYAKK